MQVSVLRYSRFKVAGMNTKSAAVIATAVAISAVVIHQVFKPIQRIGESDMDYLRRIKAVRR
jgi:hypothetical protein